jgi:hypothetical protein
LPPDTGKRLPTTIAPNVLDRDSGRWRRTANFTSIWTAEGWLY